MFHSLPQLHEEASNSIPCKTTPVSRSTNLAGAGAVSPLPTATRRAALMPDVGVTAVQERGREKEKEGDKKALSVLLLAGHKHILLWAGLHTILWPPVVISGASNCSGAVGRSTGCIQSIDDNIIAVLGRFLRKVSTQLGLCVSVSA